MWPQLSKQYANLFRLARDRGLPLQMEDSVSITIDQVDVEKGACRCNVKFDVVYVAGKMTFVDTGRVADYTARVTPWYMLCQCPDPANGCEERANNPVFKGTLEGVRDCIYHRFLTTKPALNVPLVARVVC